MAGLQPPGRSTELQDSGAHDISDEEHFSDASEGKKAQSPIPTTRVERVDDRPAHGEVPGTKAHDIRTQDATPDEYEVIPESTSDTVATDRPSIPETVVDKVDPNEPSHGDVKGTLANDLRKADAAPDVIRTAPEITRTDLEGIYAPEIVIRKAYEADSYGNQDIAGAESPFQHTSEDTAEAQDDPDGFDDDFDAFEEGGEGGEDDFGAFDDGDDEVARSPDQQSSSISSLPAPQSLLPIIDFESLRSIDEITSTCVPYLNELFPGLSGAAKQSNDGLPEINPNFLTERSQSLWEQLVAPPPLQPPDWIRSRIRRLFFVSLGVPVDLDEILPASKQKKLILPSIELEASGRGSRDARSGEAGDGLKADGPGSSSRTQSTSKTERKRRGPAPPPNLDLNSARLICSTTDTALRGLPGDELTSHVEQLEQLKQRASQMLEYWLIQRDSAHGDREAFEEVIENLVKHAKKVRK